MNIHNLTIETVTGRVLIKDLNLVINDGDKLAIIGEEGNGKSTLIKALYDDELISDYAVCKGEINRFGRIGYLSQFLSSEWLNQTVIDYLLKDDPNEDINYEKYNLLKEINTLFNNFKLDLSLLDDDRILNTLSGGEKVKLQLIKILIEEPDILLLDEPTNDIDIMTLEWLERFIKSEVRPIIFISHDETLLERTANRILHIEQLKKKRESKWTLENITYNEYVSLRKQSIDKQTQLAFSERREMKKKKEKLNRIMNTVEHQQNEAVRNPSLARLLAKKMKNLKSQEKKMNEEDLTDIPDVEEAIVLFFNQVNIPSKKEILMLYLDELKIQNKVLSRNIELEVIGNEKIVIVGKNGVGKTTLMKIINDEVLKTSNIKVGYFPQNYEELLDNNLTAIEYLKYTLDMFDGESIIRAYLGSLKFTRDEMIKKISELSGGQKAKLLLLSMVLNECNVLLLDEPTRNFSPLSNPVIRKILKVFNGTIISISHDRKYINEVCDKIYELSYDGIRLINKV